jgi:hypothetical protein
MAFGTDASSFNQIFGKTLGNTSPKEMEDAFRGPNERPPCERCKTFFRGENEFGRM